MMRYQEDPYTPRPAAQVKGQLETGNGRKGNHERDDVKLGFST